jgi:hypothetical protein
MLSGQEVYSEISNLVKNSQEVLLYTTTRSEVVTQFRFGNLNNHVK